jgi:NADPH:quinone reductase
MGDAEMKAVVVEHFGGPEVLQARSVPMPVPGAGEVRVRLMATGVNPVETYIRAGAYGAAPSLPYVPGNDGAGIVDAVGAGVENVQVGERVFVAATGAKRNTGTYATSVVCDAAAVGRLPHDVSFQQGAGIGTPGLAAGDALFVRARVQPGETVLVHGASGGVGMLAVQLAHRIGCVVYGTAGDERGRTLVERLGAVRAFDHHAEGYLDEILEAIDGRGVDAVLDMAAHANLMKDVRIAHARGRIVVVGSRGSLDFDPRTLMSNDLDVRGMNVNNLRPDEFNLVMHALEAALAGGMRVVVAQAFPLANATEAHRAVEARGKDGKIILVAEVGARDGRADA